MKKLRKQIQQVLLQYLSAIHAELIHSHDEIFLTDKILSLIEKSGYMQLAKDQTLPTPNMDVHIWRDYHPDTAYEKAQQDMLKEGWRKVELEGKDVQIP